MQTETEGAGHLCVTYPGHLYYVLPIDLGGEPCCPMSIGLLALTARPLDESSW